MLSDSGCRRGDPVAEYTGWELGYGQETKPESGLKYISENSVMLLVSGGGGVPWVNSIPALGSWKLGAPAHSSVEDKILMMN